MKIKLLILSMLSVAAATAQAQQGRGAGDLRSPDMLQVGNAAPDFKLKSKDGKTEVQLSKLRDKPVVLAFGSYT